MRRQIVTTMYNKIFNRQFKYLLYIILFQVERILGSSFSKKKKSKRKIAEATLKESSWPTFDFVLRQHQILSKRLHNWRHNWGLFVNDGQVRENYTKQLHSVPRMRGRRSCSSELRSTYFVLYKHCPPRLAFAICGQWENKIVNLN